nr:RNA-directed DNA polymerase, eukaryota, reverse transcriptase zinc-binding domain protein [Tanacetum cinerariifolium]
HTNVHDESERYGTVFSRLEAHNFNLFIDDTRLVDVPLGGPSYTWMNKAGTKMSKLDRFLVSNSIMDAVPDLKVTALARGWSDHITLMLHNEKVIKEKIKAWNHNVRQGDVSRYQEVKLRLVEIEEKIDKCVASDKERHERMNLLKECDDLNKLEEMDTFQKARVKLNEAESRVLECRVTMDEVKAAVWVANPIHIKDFRPISLIGIQYKINSKILENHLAKVVDKVVSHEQSAFISDFEKAYDSVSWKFLDHMLTSLGFGVKWRNWIQACLKSARGSSSVKGRGLIKSSSRQEMENIIRVLQVFYLASGFKINIAKSNMYGIRVSLDDIVDMARATGCASGLFVVHWRDRKKMAWVKWGNVTASLDKACVIKAIHRIDAGMDGKGCKTK